MKDKNVSTLSKFRVDNMEYKPVKNAISEELTEVVNKVKRLDYNLGDTLQFLVNIMMEHFHEDIARVNRGELAPIEFSLNEISSRIETTRLILVKDGYADKIEAGNPMWYLNLALQDIKHFKKLSKKG